MKETIAPVVIIGAGPVGLVAAIDLAWRGVDVVVIEQRHAGELAGGEMQPYLIALDGDYAPAGACRGDPGGRPSARLSE